MAKALGSLAQNLSLARAPHSLSTQALLALGGSLVLALLSQVKIPLPFTPVPVTAQSFGVLMLAAMLGMRTGTAAVLVYLAQGFAGLPVFAGGLGGIAYLSGPTAGYLAGFVAAAWLVGFGMQRGWGDTYVKVTLLFLAGHAVIFALGTGWLSVLAGFPEALYLGFVPFIPGMILKTIALVGLTPAIHKARSLI